MVLNITRKSRCETKNSYLEGRSKSAGIDEAGDKQTEDQARCRKRVLV